VRYVRGDHAGAVVLVEEGLALARAAGDSVSTGVCLHMLGTMALNQKDVDQADACFTEALTLFRRMNNRGNMAVAILNLGIIAGERDEIESAADLFHEALVIFRDLGDFWGWPML
jgi:tetratricopeptide (TPR) repeat protein